MPGGAAFSGGLNFPPEAEFPIIDFVWDGKFLTDSFVRLQIHSGRAPKECSGFGKSVKSEASYLNTQFGTNENSTDFAMGRRPKLKSEEFLISTFKGVEIIAILCLKPLKKCYTVREHDPCRVTIM